MTLASIPALFHTSSHRVCYRTCVRTYPNGTEVCDTLSRAEVITEPLLLTQPTDPTLQGMYFTTRLASPGFFARKQHTNNTICRYETLACAQRAILMGLCVLLCGVLYILSLGASARPHPL